MKIEDLEKAKTLVSSINKYNELLPKLNAENNVVRISDPAIAASFMTINSIGENDHGCQLIAQEFILKLKDYHTQKLQQATQELDAL